MSTSTLVTQQKHTFGPTIYTEGGHTYKLTATVRYDDQCGNGHNSFAITGVRYMKAGNGRWVEDSYGCLHEDIRKHFPELAPFIKWHLTASEGPMYYIENTVYHALEHGPNMAWIYYTKPQDPMKVADAKEECLRYDSADIARQVEGHPGYRVHWDEKSAKVRNLDHARSCAVWPDATDEDLTAPGLEVRLQQRFPALMREFQHAIEALGFTY